MRNLLILTITMCAPVLMADPLAVPSDRLFVPGGFDDNDRAEIVLDGYLTQSCYELVDPLVVVDEGALEVHVSAQVEIEGDVCSDDLRPFTQVVSLGVLPHGKYLVTTNAGALRRSLRIFEASNSGPDDEVYAYLYDAYVRYRDDQAPGDGEWAVILKGYFEDACQEWDYVDVIGSKDMIEVLPVVTPPDPECPQKLITFTRQINLPAVMHPGRYLLHVRSRDGLSFNEVFSVPERR